MPELPEVETVRRGLIPVLEGATIKDVQVRRPNLRWPFPERMADRLTGVEVERLRRRSKYLLCDLSSGETLIIHLGMSGRILIQTGVKSVSSGAFHFQHSALEKHDHVVLDLERGDRIVFNDARRFGAMDLCKTIALDEHRLIRALGPEPLGNSFDEDHLTAQFERRNAPVKSVLLDQRVVAGLGNIYVCEALFRSGISPKRKARGIAVSRVQTLVPVIRQVLRDAIEAGGSSLKDFRQADGELGYFQHSFQVYGREGAACVTERCQDIVHRIVQSGRSSFYCPSCQR